MDIPVLPKDFDGVFYFTNPSEEDFTCYYGAVTDNQTGAVLSEKKEFVFKAMTTSPIVIPYASPLEIQSVRKRWAKQLAEREFFKSDKYAELRKREWNTDGTPRLQSFHSALSYDDNMLKDYIQKCLEPLPISRHQVQDAPKEKLEQLLHTDDEGKIVTKPVGKGKTVLEIVRDENIGKL